MLFQINGFEISNLQKADDSAVAYVDIIANHLTEDTDSETVLKEAFDKDTVKEFLDVGVVEFWHESKNPNLSKEEKNSNLIGKPTAFRWENGKPIVTAALTKSHSIVKEMLPHLEAKQPVYAGSIGGSKMVLETIDSDGTKHKIIPKIKWDHLAIAPAPYVINRAPGINVRLLQKANDIICEFDDIDMFSRNNDIIGREEELRKALLAPGSVSDLQNTPGGAITKQSLEGDPSLTFNENEGLDLIDTIIGIKQKKIPLQKAGYLKYFKQQNKKDFGDKSFRLISKYFKNNNKRRIVTKRAFRGSS
jgi:hypothetical protein